MAWRVLISHDLNLVRRYANELIVLHEGQVVEQGQLEQIFENPVSIYTEQLLEHDLGFTQPLSSSYKILSVQNSMLNTQFGVVFLTEFKLYHCY